MITSVRRVTALCALGAALSALAACAPHEATRAPLPAPSATAGVSPMAGPPTLAPGPAGVTPVFEHGPRDRDKAVALTFDADMTADQGPGRSVGNGSTIPGWSRRCGS